MAHHIDPRSIQETVSRLGKGTRFAGTLRFKESVTLFGEYEGEIEAQGFLYIAAEASVRADVRAKNIIVGGTVHGNIEATAEIEMLPGCVVYGNVRAGKVRIAEGVVFEGRCEMVRNSDSLDVFSGSLEQLRKQAIPVIEPISQQKKG
ncbi:protein CcmA, bactofilin family [Alkalispirochaeta americana]|uniref:Protein CcmA, bactofilin family n=1 Tax=Alkalispirochaeta americana TaxID=159291 RepID=A0A1N6W3N5_9SPIO|nr:polymer-forming cytoskeletal protein [Alkalispirochaeta americana]SIQ84694.1 protein CcmA, bactofilin family [Alkalispirochaeta americana]